MRSIEFFAGSAGITAAFRSHKIDFDFFFIKLQREKNPQRSDT